MTKQGIRIIIILYVLSIIIFLFPDVAIPANDEKKKLSLKWEIVEGAVVYQVEILDSRGDIILNVKSEKNELEFNLPAGEYRVRIGSVNKFGKVDTWSGWTDLTVKKLVTPVIYKLSKYDFSAGIIEKGVRISGRDIEKGASVYIKSDFAEYQIRDIIYVDKSTIDLNLDLSDVQAGSYELIIVNPGGQKGRSPEKLRISKKSVLTTVSTGGQSAISAGYCYTHILSPWKDVYKNSVLGLNMQIFADSALIPSLGVIPVLNMTGINVEMNYSSQEGKKRDGIIRTDMSLVMLGANIYLRIHLSGKSFIRLRAGGGIAASDIKEDAVYSKSENYRSMDPFYSAAINYNFPLSRVFFIEIGVSYYHILYKGKGMDILKYSGGIGIFF